MQEKIKNFLKQNWFKITIITLFFIVFGYIFLLVRYYFDFNRYYFIHLSGTNYLKCDKIIGQCFTEKSLPSLKGTGFTDGIENLGK